MSEMYDSLDLCAKVDKRHQITITNDEYEFHLLQVKFQDLESATSVQEDDNETKNTLEYCSLKDVKEEEAKMKSAGNSSMKQQDEFKSSKILKSGSLDEFKDRKKNVKSVRMSYTEQCNRPEVTKLRNSYANGTVVRLSLILSITAIVWVVVMIAVSGVFITRVWNFQSSVCSNDTSMVDAKLENLSKRLTEYFDRFFIENISIIDFEFNNYPTSCVDVLSRNSSSSSGYYLVKSGMGQLMGVYCDMTRTCGNITGGWMRVAQLDPENCPAGLMSQTFREIKTCTRRDEAPGCTPISYSSFNVQYSKVCGKIRGYTFGTVTGWDNKLTYNITDNYLDGVSLTSGGNHVWSFVADNNCNCAEKPSFIGEDWTCDGMTCNKRMLCNYQLWNTNSCGEASPNFYKDLSVPTTSDVEIRVCRDEPRHNEDIPLTTIELFVQ